MFQFEKQIISSSISKFEVILSNASPYDISGALYNRKYGFIIEFDGIRQLLSNLDDFLNYVNFPQAANEQRSFEESSVNNKKDMPSGFKEVDIDTVDTSKVAFILHVQFRQHSTWQGTLELIAEKKIMRFNSELELIGFITEIVRH